MVCGGFENLQKSFVHGLCTLVLQFEEFENYQKLKRFFLGDSVCNVVNLTKTALYMEEMRKNTTFWWSLTFYSSDL